MNQETANKLVTLAVLKRLVSALDSRVRAEVDAELEPGDRKTAKIGGKSIGYALKTDPTEAFRVTDRPAFMAWVQANRPDEIVSLPTVRSSFEAAILERGCDENGEAIPGIELVAGNPTMTVRPAAGAEDAIRAELVANGLSFAGVLDSLSVKAVES